MALGRPVSGRHAARLARLPEKTARTALGDLVQMGVLLRGEATGQYLFAANRDHLLWDPLRRLFDAEGERNAAVRAALTETATSDGQVVSLMIFGSSARGEDVPGSDLDLLAVVSDRRSVESLRDRLEDLAPRLERRSGVRLSPIVMTAADFCERRANRDPFIDQIIRDADVIYGRNPNEIADGQARRA